MKRKPDHWVQLISDELSLARAKFPDSGGSTVALMEEVGELAKAMLSESPERVEEEAIQVACMAIRVMEEGDATLNAYRVKAGQTMHPGSPMSVEYWSRRAPDFPWTFSRSETTVSDPLARIDEFLSDYQAATNKKKVSIKDLREVMSRTK